MYEILDEAFFASGENKKIYLEALILDELRDEDSIEQRIQFLTCAITICQRTLTEADLRKYLILLQISLADYWDEVSSQMSVANELDIIRVTEFWEPSLIRAIPELKFDSEALSQATRILEEACLMQAVL